MVTLKWGDALSLLLPGSLALFALSLFVQPPEWGIGKLLDGISATAGLALLIAAALLGGVLEGLTRLFWERLVLVRKHPAPEVLTRLTPDNVSLYERGIQSSYKWVTFYANCATALLVLACAMAYRGSSLWWLVPVPVAVAVALFWASYVQWTYFANYLGKVFRKEESRC